MYLYRKNKIEFEGNKKEIIEYVLNCYSEEFENFSKTNLLKDTKLFNLILQNIGLKLSNKRLK